MLNVAFKSYVQVTWLSRPNQKVARCSMTRIWYLSPETPSSVIHNQIRSGPKEEQPRKTSLICLLHHITCAHIPWELWWQNWRVVSHREYESNYQIRHRECRSQSPPSLTAMSSFIRIDSSFLTWAATWISAKNCSTNLSLALKDVNDH